MLDEQMDEALRQWLQDPRPTGPPPEQLIFRVREVGHLLNLPESSVRALILSGELPARRLRGRLYVLREDLLGWLRRLPLVGTVGS
jgi:excisionase family DNA binding protein